MTTEANVGALHDNLLTALGTSIVSGAYPAGQVLTLDGVSAQHGMSRSVAREAIRVLESMGMVESRRLNRDADPAARPNPAAIELHDQVARAIRLRDEAAAELAMRAIIDEAVSAVAEEFSDPS